MVSWERPLTIYHPPITSYMVSYSWVKRDVADEKTFTKTGDQRMVSIILNHCPQQKKKKKGKKENTRSKWKQRLFESPTPPKPPLYKCIHSFIYLFEYKCCLNRLRLVCRATDESVTIKGWLDQWQCVKGETGCDDLCMWLLVDMRTQTLPLPVTCLRIETQACRRNWCVTTDIV